VGVVVTSPIDTERATSVATVKDKMPGCECCAIVVSKNPLKYRFTNRLVKLENSTQNKKFPVLACPECDAPLIENAKARAGKGIDE
jgi:hypothetical protein